MKKLLTLILLVMITVPFSCKNMKKEDDVYFYLTQEQKDFINTAKTGDTVIWESDAGVKDTGIVQAVVYDTYVIEEPRNGGGKKIGERAYYKYKIIGNDKLNITAFMGVYADDYDNSLKKTARCYGHPATNILLSRSFGGKVYQNVYWGEYGLDGTDTLFWNVEGFLADYKSGVKIERIK